MAFVLDKEIMRKTFSMGEDGESFKHAPSHKIRLFPYVANNNATIVTSLSVVIGEWLRLVREQNTGCETADNTINKIMDLVECDDQIKNDLLSIIKTLFWDEHGRIRPSSVESMAYIPCTDVSEQKTAQYLSSVLGEHEVLKRLVNAAVLRADTQFNVLEKAVLNALKTDVQTDAVLEPYFRLHNAPMHIFTDDLKFVLESSSRTKEYLIELLEWYYFFYTSQASLYLQRFESGNREEIIPLYFCLDWEKTNKARECYKSGWQWLQRAIQMQFCHAITLEILNQNPSGEQFDYVDIHELISREGNEQEVADQIRELCEMYRYAIQCMSSQKECEDFNALERDVELGPVFSEIHYLFESIKIQFLNTSRGRANNSYVKNFTDFCIKNVLKYRGQNGYMLNLTEERLIFLTKLAIKNEEQLGLNEVFRQFELRGVFLDQPSKVELVNFYTKLNLIDKKSDSGDAQYVKRIL